MVLAKAYGQSRPATGCRCTFGVEWQYLLHDAIYYLAGRRIVCASNAVQQHISPPSFCVFQAIRHTQYVDNRNRRSKMLRQISFSHFDAWAVVYLVLYCSRSIYGMLYSIYIYIYMSLLAMQRSTNIKMTSFYAHDYSVVLSATVCPTQLIAATIPVPKSLLL